MPLRHVILDKTYRSAWSRTLQLWKPLAMWTLLVWIMFTIILVPITTALVYFGFIRGDRLVISNEEILTFFLTPTGITFLLLIGGLTIITSIIRFSGIFHIVTCEMERKSITVKELAIETVSSIPGMFRLSIFSILLVLLAGAIFSFGLGIIYWIFLSGQDINYYLSVQPPEWTHSLIAGGVWLLLSGGTVLYIFGRISLALPAFLNSNITIRQAIQISWKKMGDQSVKLLKMLGFTLFGWFLILMITESILLTFTLFITDQASLWITHPRAVTSIAGTYIIISQATSSVIGFFGFSFISVLLTKFYHEDSDLKRIAPPAPDFTDLRMALGNKFEKAYTPVRVFVALFILLISGLGTGAYLTAQIPAATEIKILAHRSGPPPAPENTLAALELSIEQGADIAEIDVMRTANGTVVVFHDRDMMRMARDPRRISDVTFSEIASLAQLPAGDFPPSERRIATLQEMLIRGKGKIEFMIELKYYDFDPLLADEVVRIIKETEMENDVTIACLQIDPLQTLWRAGVEIPTGYISAISIGNLARLPVEYVAVQNQQIDGRLIRNARQNNIEVYAWTVNTPERVAEMINLGIDGIITDYPEMARKVADEMSELTLPERLLLNITGWQSHPDNKK